MSLKSLLFITAVCAAFGTMEKSQAQIPENLKPASYTEILTLNGTSVRLVAGQTTSQQVFQAWGRPPTGTISDLSGRKEYIWVDGKDDPVTHLIVGKIIGYIFYFDPQDRYIMREIKDETNNQELRDAQNKRQIQYYAPRSQNAGAPPAQPIEPAANRISKNTLALLDGSAAPQDSAAKTTAISAGQSPASTASADLSNIKLTQTAVPLSIISSKCIEFKQYMTYVNTHVFQDNSNAPAVVQVRSDNFFKPIFSKVTVADQHLTLDDALALGDVMACVGGIFSQTAQQYYEYAANQGNIKAMVALGDDSDPNNSYKDSVFWAKKAADLGDQIGKYEYARDLEMIDDGELLKTLHYPVEMLPNGQLVDHRTWNGMNTDELAQEAKEFYGEILKTTGFFKIFPVYDHEALRSEVQAQYRSIAQSEGPFKLQAIAALSRMNADHRQVVLADAATSSANAAFAKKYHLSVDGFALPIEQVEFIRGYTEAAAEIRKYPSGTRGFDENRAQINALMQKYHQLQNVHGWVCKVVDASWEVTTVTYFCDEGGATLGSRRYFLGVSNQNKLYIGDIVRFNGSVIVNGDIEEIQDKTFGVGGFVARATVNTIEILKKSR